MVMTRMPSGFAVIGDTQHLPGYSVLLCADESANHLTDLDWESRKTFLFDLSLLGEAIKAACQYNNLRRINYEVLGNSLNILHGHVHPRYEWEPAERRKSATIPRLPIATKDMANCGPLSRGNSNAYCSRPIDVWRRPGELAE